MLLNQEIKEMIDQLHNIEVEYQDETTWILALVGDDGTYSLELNLYGDYVEAYIYEDGNEIQECCTDCEMELSGIIDDFDKMAE
ncbi:MAG: hypothetical protein R3321_10750 [Nitrososphaeraceae archaeon]|nr:hypothetical protein [Nitrososphaeraceae archaeon]